MRALGTLLAQHLVMSIKIGLCGFTIGAAAYVKQFEVVEVQQTFYDPPPLGTLERWRANAPATFEFTMKAWQVITHAGTSRTYRRLRRPFDERAKAEAGGFRLNDTVHGAWETTLACARTLRATAILFQCPASFRETETNKAIPIACRLIQNGRSGPLHTNNTKTVESCRPSSEAEPNESP